MNLEDVRLSEIRQPRKDTQWMSLLLDVPSVITFIEMENRKAVARACGYGGGAEGNGAFVFDGDRVSAGNG